MVFSMVFTGSDIGSGVVERSAAETVAAAAAAAAAAESAVKVEIGNVDGQAAVAGITQVERASGRERTDSVAAAGRGESRRLATPRNRHSRSCRKGIEVIFPF